MIVRLLLAVALVAGVVQCLRVAPRAQFLRDEYRRLVKIVGDFQPPDRENAWLELQATDHRTFWKWAAFVPAGTNLDHVVSSGLITADKAYAKSASRSSSQGNAWRQDVEAPIALRLVPPPDTQPNGLGIVQLQIFSGTSSVAIEPELFAAIQAGRVVVEVQGKGEPVRFNGGKPFCLIRLRSEERVEGEASEPALFRGFHIYFVPPNARTEFDTDLMGETE